MNLFSGISESVMLNHEVNICGGTLRRVGTRGNAADDDIRNVCEDIFWIHG